MTEHSQSPARTWSWRIVKWALCGVVLLFVGLRAADLWSSEDLSLENVSVSPVWLLPAAAVYILGWAPSAWYWRRLMRAMGNDHSLLDTARAYYCGHLGKWVPGKVVVLVIRGGMMRARGGSFAVGAVTAAFETLLLMGAGLALGLALFPVTGWPPVLAEYVSQAWAMPALVVMAVVLALPVISLLLRKIAILMTPRDASGEKRPAEIDTRLVAVGLVVLCASWALLGLSLGLTIQAVSPGSFNLRDWPMWTGAVALATSVGFIAVFAPGGVGVREGLLIEILLVQPGLNHREAVVAAFILRLVWFVAELAAAGGFYYLVRPGTAGTSETGTRSDPARHDRNQKNHGDREKARRSDHDKV